MFHVAFPRGQRPAYADLPPTLQPHAIATAAPPADHLRAALLSGLIYASLAAGVTALSVLVPAHVVAPPQLPPTKPIICYDPPPGHRVLLPPPSASTGGPTAGRDSIPTQPTTPPSQAPPSEAASGLPTEDHSQDRPPGGGSGTIQPGPTAPLGGPVPGGGPAIHDFSSVGLAVLRQVDPIYPDFARRARIQGPVVLLMTVDEQGVPVQVQVLEGHVVFHEAARQAARQWRFEPARMNGQPVSAVFRLTLKFSLR